MEPSYIQKHYQENKEYYKEKARAHKMRYREWYNDIKSRPCLDCGVQYPPYVMDFDHRDKSTKLFDIAKGANRQLSRSKMLDEIAKCDLVCANCHRTRTFASSALSIEL